MQDIVTYGKIYQ